MSYGFGRINDLTYRAYENSVKHGFWDDRPVGDTTVMLSKLALVVSEVAEAIEAVRKADMRNLGEELADICIRVFGIAGALGINLEQDIVDKMDKNEQRPFMHRKLA